MGDIDKVRDILGMPSAMAQDVADSVKLAGLDFAPACDWTHDGDVCEELAAWVAATTCCGSKHLICELDRVHHFTRKPAAATCGGCGCRFYDHRLTRVFTPLGRA